MLRKLHIIYIYTIVLFMWACDAHALGTSKAVDTVVSIVNIYPGTEIYELEGHTMLRVRIGYRDVGVSYGVFDFNAPNFVYRFVKGETDYRMAAMPWDRAMDEYLRNGRRVVEHQLNLDSKQKQRLLALLDENLRPENAVYRYNYVKDNCATRPLAIVEKALGEEIKLSSESCDLPEKVTYRDIMRKYHENYPWYQFGIDMALGSGIDYELTDREKSFAPVVLDKQLATATVGGKPLVGKTVVLNDVSADAAIKPATWLLFRPFAVALIALALVVWCAILQIKHRRLIRWANACYFLILGLFGLLVWFLVFVSEHEATSPNLLMLWLNPLMLFAGIFVLNRKTTCVFTVLMAIEAVCILVQIAIWPFGSQVANISFYPLMAATIILCVSAIYLKVTPVRNKKI